MLEITVILEDEQIESAFDNAEVKMSKAKLKKLKEMASDMDIDIKEQLEERLIEVLEEMIAEEWES